jgi:hypothetical protein
MGVGGSHGLWRVPGGVHRIACSSAEDPAYFTDIAVLPDAPAGAFAPGFQTCGR